VKLKKKGKKTLAYQRRPAKRISQQQKEEMFKGEKKQGRYISCMRKTPSPNEKCTQAEKEWADHLNKGKDHIEEEEKTEGSEREITWRINF